MIRFLNVITIGHNDHNILYILTVQKKVTRYEKPSLPSVVTTDQIHFKTIQTVQNQITESFAPEIFCYEYLKF